MGDDQVDLEIRGTQAEGPGLSSSVAGGLVDQPLTLRADSVELTDLGTYPVSSRSSLLSFVGV